MSGGHGGARRRKATRRIIEVFQDAGDFYSETTGEVIWSYPGPFEDNWDMTAAQAARVAFKLWCRENDLRPIFERTP